MLNILWEELLPLLSQMRLTRNNTIINNKKLCQWPLVRKPILVIMGTTIRRLR